MEVESLFIPYLKPQDELLSLPTADDLEMIETQDGFSPSFPRAEATFKSHSERFTVRQRTFSNQYSNIYFKRLEVLKPRAIAAARSKWNQNGEIEVLEKLLDIGIGEGRRCIIVGTLYKEMPLVPRVLDQFTKEVCDF